jgi:hypothetical protein
MGLFLAILTLGCWFILLLYLLILELTETSQVFGVLLLVMITIVGVSLIFTEVNRYHNENSKACLCGTVNIESSIETE